MQARQISPRIVREVSPPIQRVDNSGSELAMLAFSTAGAANTRAAVAEAMVSKLSPAQNTLAIGGYLLFQDSDGGLKIRDPDGNIVLTLVTKT